MLNKGNMHKVSGRIPLSVDICKHIATTYIKSCAYVYIVVELQSINTFKKQDDDI